TAHVQVRHCASARVRPHQESASLPRLFTLPTLPPPGDSAMKRIALPCCLGVGLTLLIFASAPAARAAADWPQFMRGSEHTGDAASGKVHKSIEVGWPVTGSLTWANDSIYFQDLGGIVHCLDADGNERWRYDHYKIYKEPKTAAVLAKDSGGFPGSFHDPH